MKNRSLIIYIFLGLVSVIGFYFSSQIEFNSEVDGYSLGSREDLKEYEELQKKFPSKKNGERLIILENKKGWNSFDDYLLLHHATKFWSDRQEIEKVTSITNLEYPRKGLLLVTKELFLDCENKGKFNKRFSRLKQFNDITEKFISKNKKYTLLYVRTKENSGISPASMSSFEQADISKKGIKVHYLQYDLIRLKLRKMMRSDAIILAVISTLFILVSFFLLTKSFKGLLLIGITISFNLACTLLFMNALDISFTIYMITIPCIVIVLSFTDIMHVIYHQQLIARETNDDKELRSAVLKRVKTPMLITSLTNIIGFVVFLILSENQHLFHFSLVAIVGVLIAYLTTRLIIIHLLTKQQLFIRRVDFSKINRVHTMISQRIRSKKKIVQIGLAGMSVAVILSITFLFKIDSSEDEVGKIETPQTKGVYILQDMFFGSKKLEIAVQMNDTAGVWSRERMTKLNNVEKEIEHIFKPMFVSSPTLVAKRYHRFIRNGNPLAFTVPKIFTAKTKKELDYVNEYFKGNALLSKDRRTAKIIFGYDDRGLEDSRIKYAELKKLLAKHSNEGMTFELTGKNYISDEGTYSFTLKILFGLGIGILFSSILTLFVLKSVRESLGLIFVNLLPVASTLGLMLFVGIAITPLTLFFLSILVGICVDDSIYIITQKNRNLSEIHVFPIFVTSTVLAIGFIALGFSSFEWVRPFAWIFLFGIAVAYVMDLFILPLFLDTKQTRSRS